MPSAIPAKPAEFVGTAEDDLAAFPNDVKSVLGFAIFQAQIGGRHKRAKPLKGHKEFKGAGVMEVVDDFDGDTYRAVYTVRLAGVVYVLHAFQKKSKSGIETRSQKSTLSKPDWPGQSSTTTRTIRAGKKRAD
jgi:phage-related protein